MLKAIASVAFALSLAAAPGAYGHEGHPHAVDVRVTIQHVTKGCHELALGTRHATSLRLSVRRGLSVGVVHMDGASFRLVQTAGPKIATGTRMTTGLMQVLVLKQPGRYTLDIVRVGKSDARTVGPENKLGLAIRVR
jgi:hypothetical protein